MPRMPQKNSADPDIAELTAAEKRKLTIAARKKKEAEDAERVSGMFSYSSVHPGII